MPDFEQIQKDPESMENFINQKRLSTLITAIKKISKEMEKIESLRDSVELYFPLKKIVTILTPQR